MLPLLFFLVRGIRLSVGRYLPLEVMEKKGASKAAGSPLMKCAPLEDNYSTYQFSPIILYWKNMRKLTILFIVDRLL